MVKTFGYKTRGDGTKLVRVLDVKVDENGNPLWKEETFVAENGKILKVMSLVPTGFKIRKVGTDELYPVAIDVKDAPFSYEETTVPVDA